MPVVAPGCFRRESYGLLTLRRLWQDGSDDQRGAGNVGLGNEKNGE